MSDLETTFTGNFTEKPELRFTPSGSAVANFTLAHTPRVRNAATGNFENGDPVFMRCSVWRETAENVHETFNKGDRAIVQGVIQQRTYDAKDNGGKRTVTELLVNAIGPELRFATAVITRKTSGSSSNTNRNTNQNNAASNSAGSDEPPF